MKAPNDMTYEDLLVDLIDRDPAIMVVTAENRAALRTMPDRVGPKHFVDVGIAEMTMVGLSAGMAARGRVPVAHALSTFLTLRAFEFVRTDVGIANLPVKLVGGVPGFLSTANGPTHQAIEDIALMRMIPNMHVVCPMDRAELLEAMKAVLASPNPTYVRFFDDVSNVRHAPFELGRAETLREGGDVTLMSYGFLVHHVLEAAVILARRGIHARVVNMRSLEPVDTDIICRSAVESRLLVTVEDHFRRGGLATIVAETLCERQLTTRTLPVALDGRWFVPALLDDVLRAEGFTGQALADRVVAALDHPRA